MVGRRPTKGDRIQDDRIYEMSHKIEIPLLHIYQSKGSLKENTTLFLWWLQLMVLVSINNILKHLVKHGPLEGREAGLSDAAYDVTIGADVPGAALLKPRDCN